MSKISEIEVKCPYCGNVHRYTIWQSVNVDLDPSLKEKILKGDLFKYRCPSCDKDMTLFYGTLYHDMRRQFMIYFDWIKPEDYQINRDSSISLGFENECYTYRHVFGYRRLKEKIYILEDGLNDVAVERLKYVISHEYIPMLSANGMSLYYYTLNEAEDHSVTLGFMYYDKVVKDMRSLFYTIDDYYKQLDICKKEIDMKFKGLMCIDEEWIEHQIKK